MSSAARRIISHAYGAIGAPIMRDRTPTIVEAIPAPSEQRTAPSTRPPTGGGTPTRKPPVRKRQKSRSNVRVLRNPSVEEKAAAAWVPGMSIPALEKAAKISRSSAQKYSAKFSAQHDQAVQ